MKVILVGRNLGSDGTRRKRRLTELPDEDQSRPRRRRVPSSSIKLDNEDYRDDLLRLLFICCHPELPNTQQIALALRIVSGLSVKQIAKAFLVSEAAMEVDHARQGQGDEGQCAVRSPGAHRTRRAAS